MRFLSTVLLSFSLITFAAIKSASAEESVVLVSGEKLDLGKWGDKPYMVVNIATRCGYTGQLDDLEKLYQKFKKKGFHILGMPSNDFGGQTPEGNKEVEKFCRLKYGASFPISQKAVVKGKSKHPLIAKLVKATGGDEIKWNFEKFLVLPDGKVKRFTSSVEPLDKNILDEIKGSF